MALTLVTKARPFACFALGGALVAGVASAAQQDSSWPAYNGSRDGKHYSGLSQINRANVRQLTIAWTYDTGEKGGLQTNPLVIGRTLYAFAPSLQVIALDAASGKLRWKFNPGLGTSGTGGLQYSQPARGLAWWSGGTAAHPEQRLFAGILNYLYCLNPATGQLISSFGENGRIDLRKGLREPWEQQSIVLTTPGIVYKDLIIVGGRNPETHPAPPGDIRAFDVRTGQIRWVFHTIPRPGEPGYETWPADAWKNAGAANNWAGMALDEERGILYAPTGSAVMDFYGGDRVGDDLYANTLLALDANTGKRLWHFQGVHHDLWDRDFPAPPGLFTVKRSGKAIPALAQTTKQGYLYLFNRVTGEPLFPIHEQAYPPSNVPGEVASKTQPKPEKPEPFARQRLTEEMLTTRTPEAHDWAVKAFRTFRSDGQFVPFVAGGQQTVVFPGFDGGAEWGGPAIDPVHNILYVNANEMVWTGGLVAAGSGGSAGERLYRTQCAICHGVGRAGSPPAFPTLVDVATRLTEAKIRENIQQGNGRMPSFPNLDDASVNELIAYLKTPAKPEAEKELPAAAKATAEAASGDAAGAAVYSQQCGICHGEHMEGDAPAFPMLVGLGSRMNAAQVTEIIQKGKGRMPGQADIAAEDLAALLKFLGVKAQAGAEAEPAAGGPKEYVFTGYRKFLAPDGFPAFEPPWGTLSAIDLNTGNYLWKINLGEYPALAAKGMTDTGSENYGGPIVTAGGVVFIGATVYDHKFRAFDAATGKLLWQKELPFSGVATPATYMIDGRQYVVIAASAARTPSEPQGAAYVAFALPKR
jgi:glucose dehydrogenase